ncbi:conserved hypothetical protein [Candidatus Nitrotoga sp. HW29]|uniref:hypothetical protein n=1 Tax=Candidatus Nitrotoga sp. HW29 TaxID=2886963 RepID=UPI001EF1DAA7|nr:hypothetical protein [Candidatus Nitrotoga sp. HW29]CAH1903703.1 conserved hypothetical protein [Candidatus Nitrotoga sp. HW29]
MKTAKTSTKHPYAAIEHRVIDSLAYADLSFSARSLLVQIVRQVTVPNNNGHLQATSTYMKPFGFSVNTLTRATQELITHGFIYKTKSGGFHQGAAQFAVTWLSVTNTRGIFMQGFKACAWRDWQPEQKKSRPPKVSAYSLKNDELTRATTPKSEAIPPPKSEHIELVPIYTHSAHKESARVTASIHWLPLIAGGRMQPIRNYA